MLKVQRMRRNVLLPFRILLVIAGFLWAGLNAGAQSWTWASTFPGPGNESATQIVSSGEELVITGTFDGPLTLGGNELLSRGGTDIFLATLDAEGRVRHSIAFGGEANDQPSALLVSGNGNFFIAGTFWEQMEIDGTTLQLPGGQKGVFLASFFANGNLAWAKAIAGSALKEVTGLAEDKQGKLLVSGYFEGELFVEGQTMKAKGSSDLFLLSFDEHGELQWTNHAGFLGDTRATALVADKLGYVFLGGYYNSTTVIGQDTLVANTKDRDVFLARFTENGEPVWARKAGGVHDEDLVELGIDEDGNLFATGYLVGVMKLDEDLTIQSSTGLSDIFLLKYDPWGTPLSARALGGHKVQQATSLAMDKNNPVLTGIFQGSMSIDGKTLDAGSGFSSFLAAFQSDLSLSWMTGATTPEDFYLRDLAKKDEDEWAVAGTYRGSANAGDFQLPATEGFDVFLGGISQMSTPVVSPEQDSNGFHFFPNPAHGALQVHCSAAQYEVRIYDPSGKQIASYQNPVTIGLEGMVPGMYWLLCVEPERRYWRKLVVQ